MAPIRYKQNIYATEILQICKMEDTPKMPFVLFAPYLQRVPFIVRQLIKILINIRVFCLAIGISVRVMLLLCQVQFHTVYC